MTLPQKRHLRRPGVAEALALGVLWWQTHALLAWQLAQGVITDVAIEPTHYNAIDVRNKVSVSYSYEVGDADYDGYWQGFWPEAGSPNALASHEIYLLDEGRAITVLYDPSAPANNELHFTGSAASVQYAMLFVVGLIACMFYMTRVYPRLRAL